MKKIKLIIIAFLLFFITGCSKVDDSTENIVWGEIDETKTYIEEVPAPESAVERREQININDNFIKIPIEITEDVVSSQLPDVYGNLHNIDRIQLNGVYFDINEIATIGLYDYYVENGIFKLNIPIDETNSISVQVAQIAKGDTYILDEELTRKLTNVILEYQETYDNIPNQVSGEYGNYYTYNKYVEFLKENEECQKDITVYSNQQILEFILEVFKFNNYSTESFLSSDSPSDFEYNTWYEVTNNFIVVEENGYNTVFSVRRNTGGVFVTMVKYPTYYTVDQITGEDYFTPAMIINFAQNNYQQKAESYSEYVERSQYE